MTAREDILKNIAAHTQGVPTENHMANQAAHITPAHVQLTAPELQALFIRKAEAVGATLSVTDDAVKSVQTYLQTITGDIRVAPGLQDYAWENLPVQFGTASETDTVGITLAHYGVAETGTLVCLANSQTPTLLNFLPPISIIIVAADKLYATYEEAWQQLRAAQEILPRNINFITGPSRTGDIEQQLLLGIHGPKQLHIILLTGAQA
jgi:L-lactate dehydrogenase complex protein LldG